MQNTLGNKHSLTSVSCKILALAFATHTSLAPTAIAQAPVAQQDKEDFDVYSADDEIIVVGVKQGSYSETETVVPDVVFSGRDILALGTTDIGELIDAISAETQSTSDEEPIFLLDGRPVPSKRDIRRFPSEAVRRVEVLSPESALKFTSDPSRRVINFKLRKRFNAITGKAKARTTTDGGGTFSSVGVDTLKIKNKTRIAFNGSYEKTASLRQSQRNIPERASGRPFTFQGTITALNQGGEIDPAFSSFTGQDVSTALVSDAASSGPATFQDFLPGGEQSTTADPRFFRDLKPLTEKLDLGGSFFKPVGERISASGSVQAEISSSETQNGLIGASLKIGPDNPFSPFNEPISLHRYYGPIIRKNNKDDIEANLALYGDHQDWRWSLDGQYRRIANTRTNGRSLGTAQFQQTIDQNDLTLNPFGGLSVLAAVKSERTESRFLLKPGVSGKIASLPTGNVTGSARLEYRDESLDTVEDNNSGIFLNTLTRNSTQAIAELNIPLAGRPGTSRRGGNLSFRLNGAVQSLGGFDTLYSYGAGLNWNATNKLRLKWSLDFRDLAPKLTQLGGPTLISSNVRVTDFADGQAVFIDRITGGNPNLEAEHRREFQLSGTYRHTRNLSLNTRYQLRKTDNAISSFPFLTPQVYDAFPDRLLRDEGGQLVTLDARPVNAFLTERSSLRSGINWKKRFESEKNTKWPPNQISLSVYHTWRFKDNFQFREAGPIFDLLDGAALRRQGGEPRHELQSRFNFRKKNYGGFLKGTFETGTTIDVSSLPGSQGRNGDLKLNALAKFDLRLFLDMGRRANGRKVKRDNWRRDLRLSLDVENISNSKQFAINGLETIPFGYEKDALDPYGRTVMVSLRKVYFSNK